MPASTAGSLGEGMQMDFDAPPAASCSPERE
jgi:hypothetical protein